MKIQACKDYLSGKKSAKEIAISLNMGKRGMASVYEWVRLYKNGHLEALKSSIHNNRYSASFKKQVVEEYLSGDSLIELLSKYGIPNKNQISQWILKYNNLMELKDYHPSPEVYMISVRKTTIEEREEIVEYCIEHNLDYKTTAGKYQCSYSQVSAWVKKYKETGSDGLQDKRGKHKKEEELSEIECRDRRIKRLEHELLLAQRENEILKKVEAIDRKTTYRPSQLKKRQRIF